MSSIDTMTLLGDSFIGLAEHLPIEKISVSDIVAASRKNRKTFYYHFDGKDALIRWVFRKDLSEVLLEHVDADLLVYEKEGEGAYPTLPYYVTKKVGVRSLDGSAFARALALCLQSRRAYYAKVLRPTGAGSLQAYLRALYTAAFEEDIRFILSNRYLPEANVAFLAEFFAGGMLSYLVEKTCDLSGPDLLTSMKPFENIVHSSLEAEVRRQQHRRAL